MKIESKNFLMLPGEKVKLREWPTLGRPICKSKKRYQELLGKHVEELTSLQRLHYASSRYALLLIFQAMDAAGKDGAIRHVMSGVGRSTRRRGRRMQQTAVVMEQRRMTVVKLHTRRRSMKYMTFVLSVALIGGVGAARAEDKPADTVAQGKQLVEKSLCLVCHMVDGKGGKIGKPLNGVAEGKTDQFLHDVLVDAKKTLGPDTKMPPYKDKLNDDQIKAVIEYLKTLKKQ